MMREIPLTQGKVALVDDDMYDYLMQWKWYAKFVDNVWYAVRSEGWHPSKTIYIHREVINAPKGIRVDHKDGDGLHNWRENLRFCTNAQNGRNRRISKNNSTGFKGVYPDRNKFRAQIKVDGKILYLGMFEKVEDAARAYDAKAIELFGEFARTNF